MAKMGTGRHSIAFSVVLILCLIAPVVSGSAQDTIKPDTSKNKVHKARLTGVSVTAGVLYVGSMVGLYNLWYKDYPQSGFHFFNDNDEWLYMDKMGHITSSYWIGRIGYESLRWARLSEKKAIWYGGTWGMIYLTTVEIMDGLSAEWGASPGDMLANTLGTALFIGQQLGWKEQRFTIKFSYSPSEFAQYRPDLLGSTPVQRALKDYNGQTFWLSANIHSFLPGSSRFPRWLNVSFGYGATGMTGASSNSTEYDGEAIPYFDRYSQYYLSLDIDLTKIKTKNETIRLLLNTIGWIKIPFPTLEFNKYDKVKFYWLYF